MPLNLPIEFSKPAPEDTNILFEVDEIELKL
jgi:hypothetical protein